MMSPTYLNFQTSQVEYIGADLSEDAKDITTPTVKENTTVPVWLNALAIEHHINFFNR